MDAFGGVAQNKIGACGSAIADVQPNHFGWAAEKCAHHREIRVLGDDGEAIRYGILPDLGVRSSSQATILNMGRTRK